VNESFATTVQSFGWSVGRGVLVKSKGAVVTIDEEERDEEGYECNGRNQKLEGWVRT
jgi:hypothetical protein